ncbi:MAG TPA: glycogen debranching enzyme, partial [Acidimicrobiia bacterium]|nr:glycogen debranching enzyme [Acidimicrobiia bacterium]
GITGTDRWGQPVVDDSFLLLLHADAEPVTWKLPASPKLPWTLVIDTSAEHDPGEEFKPSAEIAMTGRSMIVLTSEG